MCPKMVNVQKRVWERKKTKLGTIDTYTKLLTTMTRGQKTSDVKLPVIYFYITQ